MFTTAGTGSASLAYFGMPEGRIRNNGTALKAEYIITDQQGNARISFEDNGSGTAVVRQEPALGRCTGKQNKNFYYGL